MASNVVVLWLVVAELELVVAEVAGGSHRVLGVLAVAGVLRWKKLALDCNKLDCPGKVGRHWGLEQSHVLLLA